MATPETGGEILLRRAGIALRWLKSGFKALGRPVALIPLLIGGLLGAGVALLLAIEPWQDSDATDGVVAQIGATSATDAGTTSAGTTSADRSGTDQASTGETNSGETGAGSSANTASDGTTTRDTANGTSSADPADTTSSGDNPINRGTGNPAGNGFERDIAAADGLADNLPSTSITQDGMYLVGTDIAPGRYVASGTGSLCYLSVTEDASGRLNSIVRTFFGDAFGRRIDLEEGQFFETDACGDWQLTSGEPGS